MIDKARRDEMRERSEYPLRWPHRIAVDVQTLLDEAERDAEKIAAYDRIEAVFLPKLGE